MKSPCNGGHNESGSNHLTLITPLLPSRNLHSCSLGCYLLYLSFLISYLSHCSSIFLSILCWTYLLSNKPIIPTLSFEFLLIQIRAMLITRLPNDPWSPVTYAHLHNYYANLYKILTHQLLTFSPVTLGPSLFFASVPL